MTEYTKCPDPGVYEDIPFADYLSWDAISNSRISLARRSLAHFKANTFTEPTPALRLGTLVHCGKLEPLAIAKRYAVMPPYETDAANRTQSGEVPSNPRATKYYKNKVSDFLQANVGKEIVCEDQYDTMVSMVTSLRRHPIASDYLTCVGPSEVSLVWDDPNTGLRCKARIDKLSVNAKCVVDLKTYTPQQINRSATSKFSRAIADFGYHRQMAHYTNGARILLGSEHNAVLVFVETVEPHCVMAAPMHHEWIDIGRREVAEALLSISKAHETGNWPGYESPKYWSVPSWYDSTDTDVELIVGGQSMVL